MTTANSPIGEAAQRELVITRVFEAPRELVWKAWTEPELFKQWWGPKIFKVPHISIDFRVGGKYLVCMQSEIGEESWKKGIWVTGVYKEIVPMERLVMTDSFSDEKGDVVPATYYGMNANIPLEMLVTVTFEDYGQGQTRMTLKHEVIPTGEYSKGANQGWSESFDKLAEVLAARAHS